MEIGTPRLALDLILDFRERDGRRARGGDPPAACSSLLERPCNVTLSGLHARIEAVITWQGGSIASLPGRVGAVDAVRARNADTAAFEAELGPLLDEAIRLATGMLLKANEAEDAVQEACVRAWRRRANRWPDTDLRPWFLAIVANQCRETMRSRWWPVIKVADVTEGPDTSRGDPEAALDLRGAIGRLPYRRRLVIVLRYYLDLPYEDVAAAAGCSVDAAKALVRRATSDLERALSIPKVSP